MNAQHPWSIPVPTRPGLKPGPKNRKSDGLSPGTKIYTWRGQTYYGAHDIAAESGCNLRTIYKHVAKYGNLDKLGGKDDYPIGRGRMSRAKPVVFEVDGVAYEWKSQRAMAKDLDIYLSRVQKGLTSTGKPLAYLEQRVRDWKRRNG